MSRGQQTFRERDVTKAIKAAVKAGIPVERVEIGKQGKISIATVKAPDAVSREEPEKNEWVGVLQ